MSDIIDWQLGDRRNGVDFAGTPVEGKKTQDIINFDGKNFVASEQTVVITPEEQIQMQNKGIIDKLMLGLSEAFINVESIGNVKPLFAEQLAAHDNEVLSKKINIESFTNIALLSLLILGGSITIESLSNSFVSDNPFIPNTIVNPLVTIVGAASSIYGVYLARNRAKELTDSSSIFHNFKLIIPILLAAVLIPNTVMSSGLILNKALGDIRDMIVNQPNTIANAPNNNSFTEMLKTTEDNNFDNTTILVNTRGITAPFLLNSDPLVSNELNSYSLANPTQAFESLGQTNIRFMSNMSGATFLPYQPNKGDLIQLLMGRAESGFQTPEVFIDESGLYYFNLPEDMVNQEFLITAIYDNNGTREVKLPENFNDLDNLTPEQEASLRNSIEARWPGRITSESTTEEIANFIRTEAIYSIDYPLENSVEWFNTELGREQIEFYCDSAVTLFEMLTEAYGAEEALRITGSIISFDGNSYPVNLHAMGLTENGIQDPTPTRIDITSEATMKLIQAIVEIEERTLISRAAANNGAGEENRPMFTDLEALFDKLSPIIKTSSFYERLTAALMSGLDSVPEELALAIAGSIATTMIVGGVLKKDELSKLQGPNLFGKLIEDARQNYRANNQDFVDQVVTKNYKTLNLYLNGMPSMIWNNGKLSPIGTNEAIDVLDTVKESIKESDNPKKRLNTALKTLGKHIHNVSAEDKKDIEKAIRLIILSDIKINKHYQEA